MKNIKFQFLVSNYLEFYNKNIRPKLCEIDIFIKSHEGEKNEFNIDDISKILYLSKREIYEILMKNNKKKVNKKNFFLIMKNGSSEICKLYKRECEFLDNLVYTKKQISYIYNIDIKLINIASEKLKMEVFSSSSLEKLFEKIPVYSMVKK